MGPRRKTDGAHMTLIQMHLITPGPMLGPTRVLVGSLDIPIFYVYNHMGPMWGPSDTRSIQYRFYQWYYWAPQGFLMGPLGVKIILTKVLPTIWQKGAILELHYVALINTMQL
jgi:hypothetical protein